MVLGGRVPLVGPQEELRGPNKYTPRGFTLSPQREAKYGFQSLKQPTPGINSRGFYFPPRGEAKYGFSDFKQTKTKLNGLN